MGETFLDSLTPDEAADLRASGRERHFDANLAIFHEGDDAGSVIVLLAGRAKLTVPSSTGREVIVAVRGPGTCSASWRRGRRAALGHRGNHRARRRADRLGLPRSHRSSSATRV